MRRFGHNNYWYLDTVLSMLVDRNGNTTKF